MPKPNQPKSLFDICLDYAAVKINDILKYEEQMELGNPSPSNMKIRDLPVVIYQAILDNILDINNLCGDNYRMILNQTTQRLVFVSEDCTISKQAEFLDFIQHNCKNIVKIDLQRVCTSWIWNEEIESKSLLVGQTFASMVHLEWIGLKNCPIDDECLKCIGVKCNKLKYLNIEGCDEVTDVGLQALCDPTMLPSYGNCTALTHLYIIKSCVRKELSPRAVSLVLLNCPNLEELRYEFLAKAVAEAIAAIDGAFAAEWRKGANNQKESEIALPTSKVGPFNLENLEFFSNRETINKEHFFRAVGKYFPKLKDLVVISPSFNHVDLHGIFGLQLQSLVLAQLFVDGRRIDHELLRLIRSAGERLTTLKLEGVPMFDLRVIKRECPNLTTLSLIDCNTTLTNATWPDYPVDELTDGVFHSLTHLTLDDSLITFENSVSLLSSPNLDTLNLLGYTLEFRDHALMHNVIGEVLVRFPKAFQRLRMIFCYYVCMDKGTLTALLHRAGILEKITLACCITYVEAGSVSFEEEPYFNELIKANNWALKFEWEKYDMDEEYFESYYRSFITPYILP